MACTKIITCENKLSALEVFLKCLIKTDGGCPVINATEFSDPVECSQAACDKIFDEDEIILSVGITENSNSIAIAVVDEILEERFSCSDVPDIETLLNEVFTKSNSDCDAIRFQDTTSDTDCSDIPCEIKEPIESLIAKTFMKSSDTGCTVVLKTEKAASGLYIDCNTKEGIETTLRKLLIPSTEFDGHYAWAVKSNSSSADTCSVFEFDMVDVADVLQTFTWDDGSGITTSQGPFPSLTDTIPNIIAGIEGLGWIFNGKTLTWDLLTVERTDIGGGLYHYIITFKNPHDQFGANPITVGQTSSVVLLTIQTDCT